MLIDESPIIDNPLGLIDIAPRVDLPLGDLPSSRSTEMRAIPLNFCPSSPVPSDDDTSIRSSKISSRLNNGKNPCKNFSSDYDSDGKGKGGRLCWSIRRKDTAVVV